VKSSVFKRSIVISGHKTSVSLEDVFWNCLKEIATERDVTLAELVAKIDANRNHANLSSAIRLFVLGVYQDRTRVGCYLGLDPRLVSNPSQQSLGFGYQCVWRVLNHLRLLDDLHLLTAFNHSGSRGEPRSSLTPLSPGGGPPGLRNQF
jgi:predicted DNA-binding ribbon-helix-helix protein